MKLNWKRVAGWGFFPLLIVVNSLMEKDFYSYSAFLVLHLVIMFVYILGRGKYIED